MTDYTDLRTLVEWNRAGRLVKAGESADYFLATDDKSSAAALFDITQTVPIEDLTRVITRGDWDAHRPRKRVALKPEPDVPEPDPTQPSI